MINRSKYLALLLRHKPEEANLTLEKDGWISVDILCKNTDFTLEELKEIVINDNKQRYSFNDDFSKIRAGSSEYPFENGVLEVRDNVVTYDSDELYETLDEDADEEEDEKDLIAIHANPKYKNFKSF